MKVLKIVLLSIVSVIALVLLGIFIFIKTFDVNKYVPSITQGITKAIGRPVSIGHIDLGLAFRGIGMGIDNVRIGQPKSNQVKDLVMIKRIHVGVDPWELLSKRQIRVALIELNGAVIDLEANDPPVPVRIYLTDAVIKDFSLTEPFIIVANMNLGHKNIHIEGPCSLESDKNNAVNGVSLKLKATIEAGQVGLTAHMKGFDASSQYDFQIQSRSVKVEDLLDEAQWPVGFKGALSGQFSGSGKGLEPETMQENLKGQGAFSFSEASINKINILKIILEKLDFLPGLSGIIRSALPSDVTDKLNRDTTILTKAQTDIRIEHKMVFISDAQLAADIFLVGSQGSIGFDQTIDMDVKTYVPADLSAQIVNKIKPLSGLLDEKGSLYIPGRLSGKGQALGYKPDREYLRSKIVNSQVVTEASTQLQKVLDKNPEVKNILNAVLGGGSKDEQASGASADSQPPAQDDSAQKVISNVLDKFLR